MSVVRSNLPGDVVVADVAIGDQAHADIGVGIGIDDRGRDRPDLALGALDQAAHRARGVQHEGDFDGGFCDGLRQAGGQRQGSESECERANVMQRCVASWFPPPVFRPSEPKFPRLHGGVRSKTWRARYKFAADFCAAARWRPARNWLGCRQWNRPPARSASCRRRTAASRRRRWRSRAAPRGCCARWDLPASANCRCPRAGAPIWWR